MRGPVMRRAAVVLLVAGFLAYANSFAGMFVFDDIPQIVENAQLESIWPGWGAVLARQRTFTEFTFALNRAAGGLEPAGYHAVNLAVHLLAAMTLFGIVRRTLLLDPARREASAAPLALAAALLWLLHP